MTRRAREHPTRVRTQAEPPPGRVARAQGALHRARARWEESRRRWTEIAERERARRPSVAAAFSLSPRHRQQAGALLAGGLAFRFFLWLLPLALLVVCTLGAARDFAHVDPVEAARTGGVSAAVAASISDAVQGTGQAWWFLLPLALWLLFWAASPAARSMRLVSAVAWRVSPGKRASMVRAAAGFTGLVAGMIACSLVTRPLFAGAAATDVLAWLLGLGAQAALALWGLTTLPRPPEVRPFDLLPGGCLFVAGLGALRIAGGWYFAHEIGKVSNLYGSLGLSVVFLTWL